MKILSPVSRDRIPITIRWSVGPGHPTFATKDEAQAYVDALAAETEHDPS